MEHICRLLPSFSLPAGTVFWYKHKNNTYGGIVLCVREDVDFALIAISDSVSDCGKAPNIDQILNASLYTAAWFDHLNLLPQRRIHAVGRVSVTGDFTNKAGMKVTNGSMSLSNIGGYGTWKHQYWSLHLRDRKMSDSLNASIFP